MTSMDVVAVSTTVERDAQRAGYREWEGTGDAGGHRDATSGAAASSGVST